MELAEKMAVIRRVDLFAALQEALLEQLVARCREVNLSPNEMLFDEGDAGASMFVVLGGRVVILKGHKRVAELGPGQYLGEMALVESKPRSAAVRAVDDAVLLELSEADFEAHVAGQPRALLSIVRVMSERIRTDLVAMVADMRALSIFTHDIKNNIMPLTMVEADLVDLRVSLDENGGRMNEEAREIFEEACDVVGRTRAALLTLLDTSLNRIKRVATSYVKTRSDIVQLILETARELSRHVALVDKKIDVEAADNVGEATFNALDIKRVLQNLVINAGCVTPTGGSICVSVSAAENDIHVEVKDHGGGIPDEIRPLLFKETLTTKKDGNGLGLLSCKSVIEESHQGRLWYESEVGKGTIFHFTIPLNPSA